MPSRADDLGTLSANGGSRTPGNPAITRTGSGASFGRALPRAVDPQPVPNGAPLDDPSLYFNHELGWLDFNWRVLHQARDSRIPLLERVKFLAISSSNLDEFYQKRVGGLKRQKAAGVVRLSVDGRTPDEQLRLIRRAAVRMQRVITRTWEGVLKPGLRQAGVVLSGYAELSGGQKEALSILFDEQIFPVLTPLAVDPGRPFPFISNLSLSLAVSVRRPGRKSLLFARIKVPTTQGRWLRVPDPERDHHFVPIEEVIAHNVGSLFPGTEIVSVVPFRVTRNADIARFEEEAEDLLAMIAEELRSRRLAPVVRLEIDRRMPPLVRNLLVRELELPPGEEIRVSGQIGLADCVEIAALDLPTLRYPPWTSVVPPRLAAEGSPACERDIFSVLRDGDVLVHHPYESFALSVQRLLDEAADDPQVLAIKQTLYRTAPNSPVVRALLRAAEKGKQVAVLVEVKARFDEANNIERARVLENAGVHVTYGLVGLKTHAKVLLVVRSEGGRPRMYCHIGTGNYHEGTSRLYTDFGLLTAEPDIGREVIRFFHALTGHAPEQMYEHLIIAPREMRRAFIERIRREVEHQHQGRGGRIVAKMNALDDVDIIQELYAASREGVSIDLIIRGHSRLRPGLPGYSANIRIVSIIGRFLEHDRVFWFENGGEREVLLGSADWRNRNLGHRVEVVAPVRDPVLQERIVETLEVVLSDNRLAFDLDAEGRYRQRRPLRGEPVRDTHEILMRRAAEVGLPPLAEPSGGPEWPGARTTSGTAA